jgi:DNA-binding transcriptional regulator YbjK
MGFLSNIKRSTNSSPKNANEMMSKTRLHRSRSDLPSVMGSRVVGEEATEELTDLRSQIERIEANAVEAFNEHMTNLLKTLEYENLDRIRIDRTTRDVREGRQKVTKSSFDFKIIRSTDEGAAYEDSINTSTRVSVR